MGLIASMSFVALLPIFIQMKQSTGGKHQRRTATFSEFQKNGMLTRTFKTICVRLYRGRLSDYTHPAEWISLGDVAAALNSELDVLEYGAWKTGL